MLVRKRYKLVGFGFICLIVYLWFVVWNVTSGPSPVEIENRMAEFSDGKISHHGNLNLIRSSKLKKKKKKKKKIEVANYRKSQSLSKEVSAKDLSSIGLIKSNKELEAKEDGYSKYSFNTLISDRIGFNRILPDTRHEKCAAKVTRYQNDLKASVIICFYNEAWSTLLRTVYSVINRTPPGILHEIILMNDQSDLPHLKSHLSNYLHEFLPSVKLFHTGKREGLIRVRVKGAELATGDVLVFLDSHCEVNSHWLEPLLARIQENRKTVVCPVIDTINSHTFEYEASPLVRGGFNWGMHFTWEDIPPGLASDESDPIKSPTMSGGLFAIDRKYFFELGSYDTSMEIWGAENLEISFRIWMCGGRLEIIPCSRVGHVFRDRRPYGNNGKGDTMSKNTVRLVEVWLDEFKQHFYALNPELRMNNIDVSLRRALRKKLNCKSFKWYLDEVYPEIGIPMLRAGVPFQPHPLKESPIRVQGKLQNLYFHLCFDTMGDPRQKLSNIMLRRCEKTMIKKVWHTWDDQLKIGKKLCLDVVLHTHMKNEARTQKCHGSKSGQEWKFKRTQQIYNPALGMCLATNEKKLVVTEICDVSSHTQKWKFIN